MLARRSTPKMVVMSLSTCSDLCDGFIGLPLSKLLTAIASRGTFPLPFSQLREHGLLCFLLFWN
jgi:hypothetical protein